MMPEPSQIPAGYKAVSSRPNIPPGYKVIKPGPKPDKTRAYKESGRMGSVMTGATAGAVIGAPAGPVGVLAGGVLGAAAGSLTFNSIEDAIRAFRPSYQPISPQSTLERVGEAGKEGLMEAGGQALTPLVRPLKTLANPLLGKIMGLRKPEVASKIAGAARQGVGLGAVDVGNVIPRGFAKAVGVFPFVGGPLKKARNVKEAQLDSAVNRILNTLAPTATTAQQLGIDIAEAAAKSHAKFKTTSALLYDTFRKAARDADNAGQIVIPTEGTRRAIGEFAEELRLGEILVEERGKKAALRGQGQAFEDFLLRAEKLPDTITFAQYERLRDTLESFVSGVAPDQFSVKRVAQIKQAMEGDLDNLAGPAGEFVKALKTNADEFFSKGITKFQTGTAGRIARSDKNMFRAGFGKPGAVHEDELLRPVFNSESPQALRELRSLVGDDVFMRGSRKYFDDAISASFRKETREGQLVDVFDPDQLYKSLGLMPGKSDKSEAVKEMLKGSGVEMRDLKDLFDAIHIAKIADPATFVMRRVVLGGIRGGMGALGVGAAAASGAGLGWFTAPVAALAVTLMARKGARIIANPSALKDMTKAFGVTVPEQQARAAIIRAARLVGEEIQDGPEMTEQR